MKELTAFIKVAKENGLWKWKESTEERKWENAREKLIEVRKEEMHLNCNLCDTGVIFNIIQKRTPLERLNEHCLSLSSYI